MKMRWRCLPVVALPQVIIAAPQNVAQLRNQFAVTLVAFCRNAIDACVRVARLMHFAPNLCASSAVVIFDCFAKLQRGTTWGHEPLA